MTNSNISKNTVSNELGDSAFLPRYTMSRIASIIFKGLDPTPPTPIGTEMRDGTIYAGISPRTNRPIYVRPNSEPFIMQWHTAMEYAEGYVGHGKPAGTFRLPSCNELRYFFKNRAEIGCFSEAADSSVGAQQSVRLPVVNSYWSSTHAYGESVLVDFDYDWAEEAHRLCWQKVRLVRD